MFSIYRYPWRCRIHIINYTSCYSIGCIYSLKLVAESGCKMSYSGKEKILQPPGWNPEVEKYLDWRFKVELWEKACIMAKLKSNERGYRLYDQLNVKQHALGEKIVSAIQVGDIDVLDDGGVKQTLETLGILHQVEKTRTRID